MTLYTVLMCIQFYMLVFCHINYILLTNNLYESVLVIQKNQEMFAGDSSPGCMCSL